MPSGSSALDAADGCSYEPGLIRLASDDAAYSKCTQIQVTDKFNTHFYLAHLKYFMVSNGFHSNSTEVQSKQLDIACILKAAQDQSDTTFQIAPRRNFQEHSNCLEYKIIDRRMPEQKNAFRQDSAGSHQIGFLGPVHSSTQHKRSSCSTDKVSMKSVEIKFTGLSREQTHPELLNKQKHAFKLLNSTENKFYHEYLMLRNESSRPPRLKIAHIFNIKSINLVEKGNEKPPVKLLRPSLDPKRKIIFTDLSCKENLSELSLLLNKKSKNETLPQEPKRVLERKSLLNAKLETKVPIGIFRNDFESKLNEYHQFLRETSEIHGLLMRQVETYPKNSNLFVIGRGNNAQLLKEVLKKRWWWLPLDDKVKRPPNFTWTQLKEKAYYLKRDRRSSSEYSRKTEDAKSRSSEDTEVTEFMNQQVTLQVHNHFENNEFLGNKKALYYNMKAYYGSQGKEVFQYLPVTFHVKKLDDAAWKAFSEYYWADLEKNPVLEGQESKRLWIVKPGENSNRGNGITIHTNYQRIKQLVLSEANEKKTFIIQKYLDRPLLYNRRKFDIRCYMLLVRLNGKIKGYWYPEGYIRTSCYEFQLGDCENQFVHLTNDAIQVNCDKYGKYEDGNKLSYSAFQKYLDIQFRNKYNFQEQICPQLKAIATDAVLATHGLLGKWNGLPTFEIFGLDFMIDEDFKPWLIEINTNPCLETSSATLQRVIPRMVDNAFKLSLDVLFPPPVVWLNSKKHHMPNRPNNNLFELIFDESKMERHAKAELVAEMGEIEQDNQVYEEDEKAG